MKQNKKVLVIEPDLVFGKNIANILEKECFIATLTSSASQAIEIIEKNIPDLIIISSQLPRHNSTEFLYEIRSYRDLKNIPVIILSIYPEDFIQPNYKALKAMNTEVLLLDSIAKISHLPDRIHSIFSLNAK